MSVDDGSLNFSDRRSFRRELFQVRKRMRIKQVREQSNFIASCIRKHYDDEQQRHKKYVKKCKSKEMKVWKEENGENSIKMFASSQKESINEENMIIENKANVTEKDFTELICMRSKSNRNEQQSVENVAIENDNKLKDEENIATIMNNKFAVSCHNTKLKLPFNEVSQFISTNKVILLQDDKIIKDYAYAFNIRRGLMDKEKLQNLVKSLDYGDKPTDKCFQEVAGKPDKLKFESEKVLKINQNGFFTKIFNTKKEDDICDKLIKNVKNQINEAFKTMSIDMKKCVPKKYIILKNNTNSKHSTKKNKSRAQVSKYILDCSKTSQQKQIVQKEYEKNTRLFELDKKKKRCLLNTSNENSISSKSTVYRDPIDIVKTDFSNMLIKINEFKSNFNEEENHKLLETIHKLLGMSRVSIDKLNLSRDFNANSSTDSTINILYPKKQDSKFNRLVLENNALIKNLYNKARLKEQKILKETTKPPKTKHKKFAKIEDKQITTSRFLSDINMIIEKVEHFRAFEKCEKNILDKYAELTENCSKRIFELAKVVENNNEKKATESNTKACLFENGKIYNHVSNQSIDQIQALGKSWDSGMISVSRPLTSISSREYLQNYLSTPRLKSKSLSTIKEADKTFKKHVEFLYNNQSKDNYLSDLSDSFARLENDIYNDLNGELKRRKIKIDRPDDSTNNEVFLSKISDMNWALSTLRRIEQTEKCKSSSSEHTIKMSKSKVGLKEFLTQQLIFDTNDSSTSTNQTNFYKKFHRTSTPLQKLSTTSEGSNLSIKKKKI